LEQPPPVPSAADYADVPGGGALPAVKPQSGRFPIGLDTSFAPSPNAAEFLPLSRDPESGRISVALPNMLRYLGTEGPQVKDGVFQTPGATIDPNTGTFGVTQEAATAAGVLGPSGMRVGAPRFVPPGTFDRQAPLSPEFRQNPLLPEVRVTAQRTPGGPASPTGIPLSEAPPTPPSAPTQPSTGGWRQVRPGEVFQPGQQFRMNQTTGQSEVFEPPPTGAPASVGAAASREGTPGHMLTMTPAEEQAYRSTAEGNKLIETQQPGIPDRRQLVPGVEPNSAELEQTTQAARELKSLKLANPAVHADALAASDANNTARQGFYDGIAGSPVQLQNAIDARAAMADRDLAAAWANKTDVTPQPVLDAVEQMKQTDDWRRPAVRNAVNSVVKELYDDNGKLITDPELLYGVRKHIGDMLSKEGAQTDPLAVRAKANLMALQGSLDGVISAGAPGFRGYLDNFSNASRPIDTMRILQDQRNGLVGTANRMEYGRFQRFMRDVVDSRSAPGINGYKSIPDETMQQLWNLRDDLRRSNGAVELAKTAGSDTAQNLIDLVRHGLARGIGSAVGGTAGSWFGPIGTGVGASVGAQVGEGFASGRAARRTYQRGQELLYPTRQNPLTPP
jgi:hypothetical protein